MQNLIESILASVVMTAFLLLAVVSVHISLVVVCLLVAFMSGSVAVINAYSFIQEQGA